MVALTVGAFGVFAALPIFWTLPTAILSGATAAAGIAAINSIGNLSGYLRPVRDRLDQGRDRIVRLGPGGGRRLRRGGAGHRPGARPRPRAGEGARRAHVRIVDRRGRRVARRTDAEVEPSPHSWNSVAARRCAGRLGRAEKRDARTSRRSPSCFSRARASRRASGSSTSAAAAARRRSPSPPKSARQAAWSASTSRR